MSTERETAAARLRFQARIESQAAAKERRNAAIKEREKIEAETVKKKPAKKKPAKKKATAKKKTASKKTKK